MLLVVTSAWAAYVSVLRSGWTSEAAAWVQAAGSIAAIAGATWVAQTEVRRARRVRRELNEEAAWHVRFSLAQAQFESQIIAAELVNRSEPLDEEKLRVWKQRAMTCTVAFSAFISRPDQIHPAVTHMLANAKVLVDSLTSDVDSLAASVKAGSDPDRDLEGRIVGIHLALLELLSLFDARMRGVRIALDQGDDGLPTRSFAAWNEEQRDDDDPLVSGER
ncbi:hypothetical protein [Aminobacter aminovorans]